MHSPRGGGKRGTMIGPLGHESIWENIRDAVNILCSSNSVSDLQDQKLCLSVCLVLCHNDVRHKSILEPFESITKRNNDLLSVFSHNSSRLEKLVLGQFQREPSQYDDLQKIVIYFESVLRNCKF